MAANVGGSGPAVLTVGTLENKLSNDLNLSDRKDWFGSGTYLPVVPAKGSADFKQDADSQAGCSKGGVVYTLQNGIKWVVAWSNMKNERNKVYYDTTDTDIHWSTVESSL
ncbi:hypothetical protein V6N11_055211 [Hibiscus sabdariffa]|uniref:Uncharacterized protein n=2 Tax=Hibiscus sabdariffa TaxID=183260 RepID=A0ABR2BQT6_9ROSI